MKKKKIISEETKSTLKGKSEEEMIKYVQGFYQSQGRKASNRWCREQLIKEHLIKKRYLTKRYYETLPIDLQKQIKTLAKSHSAKEIIRILDLYFEEKSFKRFIERYFEPRTTLKSLYENNKEDLENSTKDIKNEEEKLYLMSIILEEKAKQEGVIVEIDIDKLKKVIRQ